MEGKQLLSKPQLKKILALTKKPALEPLLRAFREHLGQVFFIKPKQSDESIETGVIPDLQQFFETFVGVHRRCISFQLEEKIGRMASAFEQGPANVVAAETVDDANMVAANVVDI